jgi:hypothetical protein
VRLALGDHQYISQNGAYHTIEETEQKGRRPGNNIPERDLETARHPIDIISDRDSTFTTKSQKSLIAILSIRSWMSTAFDQQTDSQPECMNQFIKHSPIVYIFSANRVGRVTTPINISI